MRRVALTAILALVPARKTFTNAVVIGH